MRTRRIGASVPAALPEMGSEPMAPNLKQVAAPLGMFTPSYPRSGYPGPPDHPGPTTHRDNQSQERDLSEEMTGSSPGSLHSRLRGSDGRSGSGMMCG